MKGNRSQRRSRQRALACEVGRGPGPAAQAGGEPLHGLGPELPGPRGGAVRRRAALVVAGEHVGAAAPGEQLHKLCGQAVRVWGGEGGAPARGCYWRGSWGMARIPCRGRRARLRQRSTAAGGEASGGTGADGGGGGLV